MYGKIKTCGLFNVSLPVVTNGSHTEIHTAEPLARVSEPSSLEVKIAVKTF
jgi:hypothetical protein